MEKVRLRKDDPSSDIWTLVSFASPTATAFPYPSCFGTQELVDQQPWCGIGPIPGVKKIIVKPVTHPSTSKSPYGKKDWFVDGLGNDRPPYYFWENDVPQPDLKGCIDLLWECRNGVQETLGVVGSANLLISSDSVVSSVDTVEGIGELLYDVLSDVSTGVGVEASADLVWGSDAVLGDAIGCSGDGALVWSADSEFSSVTAATGTGAFVLSASASCTTITGCVGNAALILSAVATQPGAYSDAYSEAWNVYHADI